MKLSEIGLSGGKAYISPKVLVEKKSVFDIISAKETYGEYKGRRIEQVEFKIHHEGTEKYFTVSKDEERMKIVAHFQSRRDAEIDENGEIIEEGYIPEPIENVVLIQSKREYYYFVDYETFLKENSEKK